MRMGEVFEVLDQRVDVDPGIEWLEHVAADEVVEVVDRLHRHGLVEQLHGLFGLDAEATSEVLAVVGEGVVGRAPMSRKRRLSPASSVPKSEKLTLMDRALSATTKNRSGWPGRFPGPEDLGQGDRGAIVDVGEYAEYHGKMAGVTQAHRAGRSGGLVSLGLVVPFHVGP